MFQPCDVVQFVSSAEPYVCTGKLCSVTVASSWGSVLGSFLGSGAGPTSPLFVAPSPFQAPLGASLWVVAALRVAMDTCPCPAQGLCLGSLLALVPPTLTGNIPKLIYWR